MPGAFLRALGVLLKVFCGCLLRDGATCYRERFVAFVANAALLDAMRWNGLREAGSARAGGHCKVIRLGRLRWWRFEKSLWY